MSSLSLMVHSSKPSRLLEILSLFPRLFVRTFNQLYYCPFNYVKVINTTSIDKTKSVPKPSYSAGSSPFS